MKIHFIGTGSAFTLRNFHTNYLIEQNGKFFLVDAGGDVRLALHKYSTPMTYKNIDAFYISHLHADHAGGVEYLGFNCHFDKVRERMQMFINNKLFIQGWQHTWSGGLASVEGKVITLEDCFDITTIRENTKFFWEEIEFQIVQTVHIMNGFAIVPSYGLMAKDPTTQKTVYFTTDTQFCPHQMMNFYNHSDLILQDCETTPFKSGVHSNFLDLVTLPTEIKAKMFLTHYQDNILGENDLVSSEWETKAKDAGFRGFAQRRTSIEINDLFFQFTKDIGVEQKK